MVFESLRRETLDRKEQEAFAELSNAMIFETPTHIKLSQRTVPQLSRALQDAFRAQDELHEKECKEFFDAQIQGVLDGLKDTLKEEFAKNTDAKAPSPKPESKEHKQDDRTDGEKILDAARMYISGHGKEYWQSQRYGTWGFTPKLAGARSEEYEQPYYRDGKNCFGVVQGLGGLFHEYGLPYEMGITADHPFVVTEVDGKPYLASLYGIKEAKGTFEQREGYRMYKPAKGEMPYEIMTVWNFDQALVYELLENFEVLRRISLGGEANTLPGSEDTGKQLAEKYRDVLQKTSWRDMQAKVTPKIAEYFHDERVRWQEETERIAIKRMIDEFFVEVVEAAKVTTRFAEMPLAEFLKEFLPMAKEHSNSISDMMHGSGSPIPGTPPDVVNFTMRAKEVLGGIDIPELRADVTHVFMLPFIKEIAAETLKKEGQLTEK